jgi:hypothetical protein
MHVHSIELKKLFTIKQGRIQKISEGIAVCRRGRRSWSKNSYRSLLDAVKLFSHFYWEKIGKRQRSPNSWIRQCHQRLFLLDKNNRKNRHLPTTIIDSYVYDVYKLRQTYFIFKMGILNNESDNHYLNIHSKILLFRKFVQIIDCYSNPISTN